ncbi:MAG: hypothetical protein Q4E67_05280 [Planctomycetia bacterium]|nr:hypothetical protein [Planctomycetia bacterium]
MSSNSRQKPSVASPVMMGKPHYSLRGERQQHDANYCERFGSTYWQFAASRGGETFL